MSEPTRTLPLELLHRVHQTLVYYSNVTTYQAPRIGGVLAGCPRGEKPTPEALTREAHQMADELLEACRAALPVAPSVPAFDPTQPCDLERIRRGEKFGWGGVPTMCMRCKNPHHACDHEVPLPVAALSDEQFERALRRLCFQRPTPEAYDLAKCIWNEARALLRHSEGKE